MKKLSSAVAIILVAALLTGTIAFTPRVFAANTIYLMWWNGVAWVAVPPAISYTTAPPIGIGYKFNVSVWCTTDVPLGGAEAYMEFNDSIINCTRSFVPLADPSFFYPNPPNPTILPVPPNPGYVHLGLGLGRVQVAVTNPNLPPAPPFGHNGLIVILEFNITAVPTKAIGSLSCLLHLNSPIDTYLLDQAGNTLPGTLITDGNYIITWAAPPVPHLGLAPTTTTFGPDPPSAIGQTFLENLTLRGYYAAWGMNWVSFDFQWNSTVIDVLGVPPANITLAPGWTYVTLTYTPGPPYDYLSFNVTGSPGSDGDILIATLNFTVMKQQLSPPVPAGTYDDSPLQFNETTKQWDQDAFGYHLSASDSGSVTVYALRTLKAPWFYVTPQMNVFGPEPVIGNEFTIGVGITGPLDYALKVIGAQVELYFNDSLIVPVSIDQGPFFQQDGYAPYGTFFFGQYIPGSPGPNAYVLLGTIILPNNNGVWDQTSFANGTGIIANIRFKIIDQQCPYNFTSGLIIESLFGQYLIDVYGNWVPVDEPKNVNGLVVVQPFNMPGRNIDLYGGAVNDGYGVLIGAPYLHFPVPFGGQGPNHWMDLVFPQSWIYLHANVTYNYWPVQSKDVGFEIEGPFNHVIINQTDFYVPKQTYSVLAKLTATTDSNGVASIAYRMPWPCDNPDGITGVYKITSTVTIADQVVNDTMLYYYERLVYITSVTTDSFYYTHLSYIKVTVNYQTHSVQQYPALFAVVLTDDLGVPFGMALYETTVGGATFCTWELFTFDRSILIPKWAYAGYGLVHVSCYDKDPTVGGEPLCPEYTPNPQFQIGPY
jgi:hypothetical protein